MTRTQLDLDTLRRTCLGIEEAVDLLRLWNFYVHAVDDIEDETTTSEFRLRTFAMPIDIYTHPFYLKHLRELRMIVRLCTNAYADVVAWEKSDQKWQNEFADVYRHFGQEFVFAVAALCAEEKGLNPHDHLRSISQEWRTMSYFGHHDKHGNAT